MGAMLVRHEPSGVAAVRRELAMDLDLRGVPAEAVEDIALVTSELVNNAVHHGGIDPMGDLDVSWSVGTTTVVVSVEDPSPALPRRQHAAKDASTGRGLEIIEALAEAWGVERTPRGKRVWVRISFAA